MGHLRKAFWGLLIAALLAAAPVAASAATFTVNSTNDSDDATCDAGHCSLREAINAANNAAGADDIVFDAGVNGGTIVLGDYLPGIYDDLTITGPGSSLLTIDANDSYAVFYIDGDGDNITVSISGLYLYAGDEEDGPLLYVDESGDTVMVTGVTFADGYASYDGGAIYNYGDLTLTNSHLISNYSYDGDGGAIYNNGGMLTITGGSFRSNDADCGDGGAIYNDDGDVTITGTVFDDNDVDEDCSDGGAIYTEYGTLTITNAVFTESDSDYGYGGAIYIEDAEIEITNSTFANNYADEAGGAIYMSNGELTITGSTFTNNDADSGNGGAIYVSYGNLTVMDSTITNNYADQSGGGISSYDTVTLINTIVENNFAADCCSGGGIYLYTTGGALTVEGSTIRGNDSSYGSGGGVAFYGYDGAELEITGTEISDNQSNNYGGGIYASGTGYTLLLSQSTVSGNYSYGNGGGIYVNSADGTIERSSIVDNFAEGYDGGGIYFNYGELEIVNSTLSGNTTDYDGGGIYAANGTLGILHSTITNNVADVDVGDGGDGGGLYVSSADVTVTSSIIAGNLDFSPGGESYPDLDGTITSGGTNLIGSEEGADGLDESDIVGMDPLLGPLVSLPGIRGSSVHPLLMGSPARAAAAVDTCPDTDQLGLTRAPLACDIGAMRYITLPGVDGGIVLIPDTGGCVLSSRASGTFGSEGLLLLLAIGGAFHFERRRRMRAQS